MRSSPVIEDMDDSGSWLYIRFESFFEFEEVEDGVVNKVPIRLMEDKTNVIPKTKNNNNDDGWISLLSLLDVSSSAECKAQLIVASSEKMIVNPLIVMKECKLFKSIEERVVILSDTKEDDRIRFSKEIWFAEVLLMKIVE